MKPLITIIAILTLITTQATAQVILSTELVVPTSLHSDHFNDGCNPKCAVENNGGEGFRITFDYDNKIHLSYFYMKLTNSFGDPGSVEAFEPAGKEVKLFNDVILLGVAAMFLKIEGYKDAEGKPYTVYTPPMPRFHAGINPVFWLHDHNQITKNVYLNYNVYYLPTIRIDWFTIEYKHEF